ncbi:methyltransferase domain-containing protein [Nocardiopsis sp. RSe5-2]|uniref:Protein-L-isoaspartate O-methyltransferase n=1 Tax=Nocardiopsis endophytica TaxID=3018445 RepID=A0ABT4U1S0_9ACTN|nr:methyltransferase domain-containing protein [Nocardiopsis endophytica]MDA2810878.1 methyltransferase domain-containing protein [Nocardiopsis endophytica]
MTDVPRARWGPLLERLADDLTPEPLSDPAWERAFREVPRHLFVPVYYDETDDGAPTRVGAEDPGWLEGVYTDDSLITQLRRHPQAPGSWWPTSSSSRPSLMVAMLHALDVRDGHRVLEIGTGSGYNAALLSARLGGEKVTTVDIDPELTSTARRRLAGAGHRPAVVTGDGAEGAPERAPFDRVIVTHSVEQVPYAWIAQTRPGGLILVDVRSVGTPRVGHLARLGVHEDGTASGGFDVSEPGFFMPARHDITVPQRRFPPPMDLRDSIERSSEIGARALDPPGAAFWLWALVPDIGITSMGGAALLFTPDGAWATADELGRVRAAGPHDLWALAEKAQKDWEAAGRPGVEEYLIEVGPQGQRIIPPIAL